MPCASAISNGSLYVLSACQVVAPLIDHSASGAVPVSSTRVTLARAPPAEAMRLRSAASFWSAAVRLGGLGLGVGDGSGLGLGVTAATGLGDGLPRLPVKTSGIVSGTTTTMNRTRRTKTTPIVMAAPANFTTRARRGAALKSYAIEC